MVLPLSGIPASRLLGVLPHEVGEFQEDGLRYSGAARDQTPSLKARRALTARSTSAASPAATGPSDRALTGLILSNVSPERAAENSRRCKGAGGLEQWSERVEPARRIDLGHLSPWSTTHTGRARQNRANKHGFPTQALAYRADQRKFWHKFQLFREKRLFTTTAPIMIIAREVGRDPTQGDAHLAV
jgi:hypothetical protein